MVIDMDKEDKKRITKAKRLYTTAKTVRVYTNKIEKHENDLFINDQKLADLVKQKEEIEAEIINKIDLELISERGFDVEKEPDEVDARLLQLLKDAKYKFEDLEKLGPDGTMEYNDLIIRLESEIEART